MRTRQFFPSPALYPLALAVASATALLAGCDDPTQPNRPEAPAEGERAVTSATSAAGGARAEEYRPSGPPQRVLQITTYLPFADTPQKVTVEVRNGLAIMEGDIVLGNADSLVKASGRGLGTESVIVTDRQYRWPSGTIPFEIQSNHPATAQINAGIASINQNTNLRLVPRTNQTDYVRFVTSTDPNICGSSQIGRAGGRQLIEMGGSGCGTGSVIHEIGHAAGLFHEQSRGDRDDYVTVNYDNILDGYAFNFDVCGGCRITGQYDFASLMHYGPYAFSKNGQPTITINGSGASFGQPSSFSVGDVQALQAIYNESSNASLGRYTAVWRPSTAGEIQVYGWTYAGFRAKYDELWPQGWRLKQLNVHVVNGQPRYTAVWKPSTEGEIQVYGWSYEDFRAKYDELWPQGWRLKLLSVYVLNGQVLYTAAWKPSTAGEIQVYGWTYEAFRAKYDELWPQGWRLKLLDVYVVNGEVLYTAVWQPSTEGEIQIYNWSYEDYQAKYAELFQQGWRLKLVDMIVLNGQELYTAVWRPSSEGEFQLAGLTYEKYRAKYDQLWQQGWRLKLLKVEGR